MKKNPTCFKLYVLIATIFLTGELSQAQQYFEKFAVNPKISFFNGSDENGGIMAGMEFNATRNKLMYSVDYLRYEEYDLFGPSPSEYFNQVGFMLGKYVGEKNFRLQYQAGLAPLWGKRRGDFVSRGTGLLSGDNYEAEDFFTVGFQFKLGFKVVPSKFFSFGLDLQANMNSQNSVYMPVISFEFGRLK